MKYSNILEEEIKNALAADYFSKYDCTKIQGKIDFAVKTKRPKNAVDFNDQYLLWAEAKQRPADIVAMRAQLVLTIGKARTFDEIMPPPFLGAFDNEKIAFVPYSEIQDIFYQNDFNWNVAPSNKETKEFKQVYSQIEKIINNDVPWETYLFYFEKDDNELRRFIRENVVVEKSDITQIKINKNNFITIYNKWLDTVKPTIQVRKWDAAKKAGIIDGDFYLADLLSDENKTLKEKLFVLLKTNHYELDRQIDESGFEIFKNTAFSDNQKAHNRFWAKYERPPLEDYWDYIIERRDLLVPQDVRERKGSYFTPKIWVEKSQEYLADVFGKDWQDEYYIWDCAAGTGNLLAGLTNKYNIWASTLDKQDVDVMYDRIKNGANLLGSHVFQFDFLNDDFSKLPESLQKIINDENLRKKLIIYINPPYAEARGGLGRNSKEKVATEHKTHSDYKNVIGNASNEVFAQFFARIYDKCPNAYLAQFSTLKIVQSRNFAIFRNFFRVKFLKGFVVPANTFDNVKGNFPIGFMIWRLWKKEKIEKIKLDTYDEKGILFGKKLFYGDLSEGINQWISKKQDNKTGSIGYLDCSTPDFQNQGYVFIDNVENDKNDHRFHLYLTVKNLINGCVYFAVRHCIEATWLNDRDQFLFPKKKWENDIAFHNDCLAYTLFHSQNRISSKDTVNHWIPFSESEVGAHDKFESHFMYSFLSGKIIRNAYTDLFDQQERPLTGREFSADAQDVFSAGKELWKYYHTQPDCNVNASLYDIREYFQGRSDKGKMNNSSTDKGYNERIAALRTSLKILAKKN